MPSDSEVRGAARNMGKAYSNFPFGFLEAARDARRFNRSGQRITTDKQRKIFNDEVARQKQRKWLK